MPIHVQCANGHPLQVETSLAGKHVRCKRCGEILEVPQPSSTNLSAAGPDQLIPIGSVPALVRRSDAHELVNLELPSLEIPGSRPKSREFEPPDFLFQAHPRPVQLRYSLVLSLAMVMLPLLVYLGLRVAIQTVSPEVVSQVKRLAMQHSVLDDGSPLELAAAARRDGSPSSTLVGAVSAREKLLIRDVCLGGNGRYLITHHAAESHDADQGYVSVQDLQQRLEIGRIAVDDPHVGLAASMDTLVVGGWGSASLQAYELSSLKRFQQRWLPPEKAPITLAMGHASDGPLYVINAKSQLQIFDLPTLTEGPYERQLEDAKLLFEKRSLCQASADGSVFASQGSHLNLIRYARGRIAGAGRSTVHAADHVAPTLASDGRHLFTPHGVYSSSLAISDLDHRSCLAAASGPYFVGPSARTQSELNKLWLYVRDHPEPIAEIPTEIASPLAIAKRSFASQVLTNEKRLILIPSQRCIVTIDPGGDQTTIHDFDFDQAARRAGVEAAYFTSIPQPQASRGVPFHYQVELHGFSAPTFALTLAPPGMEIDQAGHVRWQCDAGEGTHWPVVIRASEGPRWVEQVFHVKVGGPLIAATFASPEQISVRRPSADVTSAQVGQSRTPPANAAQEASTEASQIVRIDLPGIVRQPTLAGDGRFLIVRLIEIDALGIIDLLNPSDVRYMPISASSLFAASRESIVIYRLDDKTLTRFDLRTLDKTASAQMPSRVSAGVETPLHPHQTAQIADILMQAGESKDSRSRQVSLSMGFQSDGPLLYSDRSQGFLIDLATLKPFGAAAQDLESSKLMASRWGFQMLPRGDGFVGAYDYHAPMEIRGGTIDGEEIQFHLPLSYAAPVHTTYPGISIVQDAFRAAVTKQVMLGVGQQRENHLVVPAANHTCYLAVEMRDSPVSIKPSPVEVYLYLDDDFHRPSERRRLTTLSPRDLEPPPSDLREYRGFLPWERRVIYLPELQRLVTLPVVGNRVVVIPVAQAASHIAAKQGRPGRTTEPSFRLDAHAILGARQQ